jgi:hypothetical protein
MNPRGSWAGDPIAALIHPLPPPLVQPRGCVRGQLLVLGLRDGRTLRYGPCRLPGPVESLRHRLDASFLAP